MSKSRRRTTRERASEKRVTDKERETDQTTYILNIYLDLRIG